MNDFTIDIASKFDLPQILGLQKKAYKSEAQIYNDFSIPPLTQSTEELEIEFQNQLFLKAESKGDIVGSVRAFQKDGVCFIGKLIVSPSHQNQGLGSMLLNEIESKFSTVKKYELFTGDKSEKNLHIYKKHGYKISGRKNVSDKLTLIFLNKNNKTGSAK
jgi:predicted N-acetyltransferase YhbS